ncbi:MAG: GGDEF domain-containing protein [Pseudomonadota bacterium]
MKKKSNHTTKRTVFVAGRDDTADEGPASLVIIHGEPFAKVFHLEDGPVTLGRGADCDIQFGHENVSRRHCRISTEDSSHVIEDCGSTNGTFLNGERLAGKVRLRDSDRISIGDMVFKFVSGDSLTTAYHSEAYARATEDHLTGVANHRLFEEHLERETNRCLRYGQPLSCCAIGIVGFGGLERRFEREIAEEILVRVVEIIQDRLRELDFLARVGDGEFAVLLPGMDGQEATVMAQSMRQAVGAEPLYCGGESVPVDVCIGIAEFAHRMRDPWTLFRAADRALLSASDPDSDSVCVARVRD